MKVIATIVADLEETPLGTRSRLADDLHGKPILRHTLERVRQAERIDAVYVFVPAAQAQQCKSLLAGVDVEIVQHEGQLSPWSGLVRVARKWSLDGWRGGIGGTTSFDEFTNCQLLSGFLKTVEADAVLSIPAASPLFDPELADRMVRHREQTEEDIRLTFTQSPPGLAGILLDSDLVHELAQKNSPVGWTFSYQPDSPRKDLLFQSCCCEVPRELRHSSGRLIADTDRAVELITSILQGGATPDATTIGRRLLDHAADHVEPVPREIEIELTTADPYPDALLRPRGQRVGQRGPIDPAIVRKLVEEVSLYDDALVVLGGFGDPLRHPQFIPIMESVKADRSSGRGAYGLAVRTSAVDLSDEFIEAMIAHGVDILQVGLDAWSPELYRRLQSPHDPGAADLSAVLARLDRLAELCQQHSSPTPVVVPEMIKARENVHELDDFYDGWIRRLGSVVVSGASHYASQFEDHGVVNMTPPGRFTCRRLGWRCLILADGRVAVCDQDCRGMHTLKRLRKPGSGAPLSSPLTKGGKKGVNRDTKTENAPELLEGQTLEEIWQGEEFAALRQAHRAGRFDANALCRMCDEWHRP